MSHAKSLNGNRFIMEGGFEVPISKSARHETKRVYLNFLSKNFFVGGLDKYV